MNYFLRDRKKKETKNVFNLQHIEPALARNRAGQRQGPLVVQNDGKVSSTFSLTKVSL